MDGRAAHAQFAPRDRITVALTSYLGVSGTNLVSRDGLLFLDSRIRIADVVDGTSQTLLVGERPASPDNQFGWWYAGRGQASTGSCDMVLGVQEINVLSTAIAPCPRGGYGFGPGELWDPCAMFHFWSLHPSGGHFLFVDGSVRMVNYSASAIVPSLATRGGQEVITLE
jgi:prepilin-type processing-associated H-X9-DG protein